MEIISKIFYFVFFISLLNIIRHGFYIAQHLINSEKYMLEKKPLLLLGLSLACVLTIVFTGFKI